MNEELKPCPFCGNMDAARVVAANELHDADSYGPYSQPESYAVMCDASTDANKGGCGGASGFNMTRQDAIAAWNRRAPEGEEK